MTTPEIKPWLVVAHAQHPLKSGIHPGTEFASRLDVAARLLHYYSEQEVAVNGIVRSAIYVPGSQHRGDAISLAEAGTAYLIEHHGISHDQIHGDDWNTQYKPTVGVYNAGDEVFVAAHGFRESVLAFGGLQAICAPSQVKRLKLHYRAYNLTPSPTMHPVQAANADYHAGLLGGSAELALTLYTKLLNPTWQNGRIPALIRSSRLPK